MQVNTPSPEERQSIFSRLAEDRRRQREAKERASPGRPLVPDLERGAVGKLLFDPHNVTSDYRVFFPLLRLLRNSPDFYHVFAKLDAELAAGVDRKPYLDAWEFIRELADRYDNLGHEEFVKTTWVKPGPQLAEWLKVAPYLQIEHEKIMQARRLALPVMAAPVQGTQLVAASLRPPLIRMGEVKKRVRELLMEFPETRASFSANSTDGLKDQIRSGRGPFSNWKKGTDWIQERFGAHFSVSLPSLDSLLASIRDKSKVVREGRTMAKVERALGMRGSPAMPRDRA